MSDTAIHQLIYGPHVSEKSTDLNKESNQYVFEVAPSATKTQVRDTVRQLFDVKIRHVRIVNIKGKRKRNRWGVGRRSSMRKAYVSLMPGQHINMESA